MPIDEKETVPLGQIERILTLLEQSQAMQKDFLEMIKALRERIEVLESKVCN